LARSVQRANDGGRKRALTGSVKPCAVPRLPAYRMTYLIQLTTLDRIDRFNCGLFADIKDSGAGQGVIWDGAKMGPNP